MARRKTHEEYVLQVAEKAPHIVVKEAYRGNRTPIEHYCLVHMVSWQVSPFNFLQHSTGCPCCQKEVMDAHIRRITKTDEQFRKEVSALGTGIIPLDQYQGSRVKIRFQCSESHIWQSTPHDVLEGYGCPCCAGNGTLRSYNDLWTTDPEIAKMLKDPEVGYTISRGSHKKVEWICPDCGKPKISTPKQVVQFGLSCSYCSDKISYPNKFIISLLLQAGVRSLTPEWSPEWIGRYRYDAYFMIDNKEYVVEMDGGLGHGNMEFKTKKKDTKGLERDVIKNSAADGRNIVVIRIDCNYTDMKERFQYVRQSISDSQLGMILDLSSINWDECNVYATSSLHMKAARMYDSGMSIRDISNELYVSYSTIYNWLKRLSKEGLCTYNPTLGRNKL